MERSLGVQCPFDIGAAVTAGFAVIGHVVGLDKGSGHHMIPGGREGVAAVGDGHAVHQIAFHRVARCGNGGNGDSIAHLRHGVVDRHRAVLRGRRRNAAIVGEGLVELRRQAGKGVVIAADVDFQPVGLRTGIADSFQAAHAVEGVLTDGFDTLWDIHRCDGGAAIEGVLIDLRHCAGNHQIRQQLIAYIQAVGISEGVSIITVKGNFQPCVRVGDNYLAELVATVKCIVANRCNTATDSDRDQI